jgi:hypothetical protein
MKNCNWLIFRNYLKAKLLIPVLILTFVLIGFSAFSAVFRKVPYLLYPKSNAKAEIYWQLDATATCSVNYGLSTAYGTTVNTTEYGTDHQHKVQLASLNVNTKYYYRVNISGSTSVTGSFKTGADDNATDISFYAYGDTRTQPVEHNSVCNQIVADYSANPANQTFIVVSGDLVYDGNTESYWDNELFRPQDTKIREMMGSIFYMASMGNHEGQGLLFEKYFPYQFNNGKHYYSFDYGPAHFTVVDQYNTYTAGSTQYNWIVSDLSGTTKPWKFILLHEPGWSAAGSHANNTTVQTVLQPLAVTYGVQFFIAGHNHYYSRATVSNIQHITTGGGGAPLNTPVTTNPNLVKTDKSYHFCKINISGNRLDFAAIRSDGTPIENFTIYRTSTVTPTFNQIGPLCQNSTPPALPLVSTNEITGTWSPSVISTASAGSVLYTFTPTAGQNASTATMTIVVNPNVVPTFTAIGPFYQGSTPSSLPVSSLNGISGTWVPSVISTAALGTFTFTFTPNAGQCATSTTIQVVILPKAYPVVSLTAPLNGATFSAPASITLTATATDADGTITAVAFYWNGILIGSDTSAPWSVDWTSVPVGSYQLTAVATDNDGLQTTSGIVNITVNTAPLPVTFEKSIVSGSDDVEEYNSGTMLLNSDDIEMVYDSKTSGNQKVGLRFTLVNIPKGATVTKAYLRFTVDEIKTAAASLLIQGQNADNAAGFTSAKKNVSSRVKTVASVTWVPSGWSTTGVSQQTPDLKAVVQEIVNRTSWVAGNSMAFIISGTGTRTAVAFETSPSASALLHVEYTTPAAGSNYIASEKSAGMPATQRTEGKLTCYPVPFTDVLNISFEPADSENLQQIYLYSVTGSLLKTINSSGCALSLDLERFPSGIYMIGAQTNRNRYVKTVVKK